VEHDVRLAGALRLEGYPYDGLSRMVKAGEFVRVRHGAYAAGQPEDSVAAHRRLIAATLPVVGTSASAMPPRLSCMGFHPGPQSSAGFT
jgi:hypothetical protein